MNNAPTQKELQTAYWTGRHDAQEGFKLTDNPWLNKTGERAERLRLAWDRGFKSVEVKE